MYKPKVLSYFKIAFLCSFTMYSIIALLSCNKIPTNPDNPSNTTSSLLLKSSSGISGPEMVNDSVGEAVQIMALLRYPDYVNFVKIDIYNENGSLDSTNTLAAEKSVKFDTVGIVYKPRTPGNKRVIATTSVSNGTVLTDSAIITVFAHLQGTENITKPETTLNLPPKWKKDSIEVRLSAGSVYNLLLRDTCSDPDNDTLQFVIIGSSKGVIANGVYSFVPAQTDSGLIIEKISASDKAGLSDTLSVYLTIKKLDVIPPVLKLIDPVMDSMSISAVNYTMQVKCNDNIGVKTVTCTNGANAVSVVKISDSIYSAAITGILSGTYSMIVFTAADNAETPNITTLTTCIKFDPSLTDNIAPNITLVNPKNSGDRLLQDSITVQIACNDESGVAYVTCSRAGAAVSVTNSADSLYSVKITGLTAGKYDTLIFLAVDKSINSNKKSFSAVLNYLPAYTVTYSGNGNSSGNVPVDEGTYKTGDTVIVKGSATLAKAGSTFSGWSLSADGNGTSYSAGDKFVMGNANAQLYARWSLDTCTISYNLGGGTNAAVNPSTYTITSGVIVLAAPVNTGFTFAGWFTDAAFATAISSIPAGSTGNITLFAKWTVLYTVTYNGNGNTTGTVPTDVNTYSNGVTVTVLENTGNLKRTGYTFDGWYTNAAGSGGTLRTPGSTFAIGSADVVLYVKWLPDTYIVTFDSQGAETATSPSTKNVTSPATKVDALPSPPTKNGYVFAGWWTSVNGAGTQFTINTIVSANVTVYAKWLPNTFVVTFDGQGATFAANPATKSVTFPSDKIDVLPASPQKTGYVFAGWWTSANGAGTQFTASTPVSTSITLYANWEIRDASNNKYSEVLINGKVWMGENLHAKHLNDGTPIYNEQVVSNWVSLRDPTYYSDNGSFFYIEATIKSEKLPIEGWHIPTVGELTDAISSFNNHES